MHPPDPFSPSPTIAEDFRLVRAIIDAVPDPIFCKDLEGRFLLTNQANCRMYGLEESDFIGRTVFELAGLAAYAELYHADDLQVIRTGEPVVSREEPYTTADGRNGFYLTSKFPLRDTEGVIVGLVGIARDISVRKETERRLTEERAFLQALIDAIPDLIFFKDRAGRHLHMNAADRLLFGDGDVDLRGKTVHESSISAEIAQQYTEDDRHVIETGEAIVNREEPFERTDGSRGWFLTTKLPLRSEAGEITGLLGISRDITQLKSDREELEGARERLADHVANSPLAVIEWDPDFRVERWTGRAAAIFGWSAEEVEGKTFFDWSFVHPDDLERVKQSAAQLLDGGEQRNVLYHRNLSKAGETVHCVWHNSVLHDTAGRAVSVLSLVQDVTEQVRAEESARRAEAERALIERKLLETQKLESLGVLAGGIAHDFNNLLTGVLGNATLASSDLPTSSPVQRYLVQIERAALRAADLCKQMLAYSGKGRFVTRRLDLNRLIAETASLLRVTIARGAEVQIEAAPDLPPVLADEAQMQQIVMNLVINASEALGQQGGTICVSTGVRHVDRAFAAGAHLAPELPEGEYVFLEVKDSGCGMTPDLQSRIFDPFFSTKFTGRGLGLAAVLGIVRGHRGAVRVESSDAGSSFLVLLPRAEGAAEEKGGTNASSPGWQGHGKILIVDDEEPVRAIASHIVKTFGFEVAVAADGREGLTLLSAAPDTFRLVLVDLTMPRLDGVETFRQIRELRGDLPVLLMSGFSERDLRERFAATGFAGFVQKPFDVQQLRSTFERILG